MCGQTLYWSIMHKFKNLDLSFFKWAGDTIPLISRLVLSIYIYIYISSNINKYHKDNFKI